MTLKKIKTISSHAGHFRFLHEQDDNVLGWIPRQKDIPSPYSFGPSHLVGQWNGKAVIVVETRHKRYEVFEVPREMILSTEPYGDGTTVEQYNEWLNKESR